MPRKRQNCEVSKKLQKQAGGNAANGLFLIDFTAMHPCAHSAKSRRPSAPATRGEGRRLFLLIRSDLAPPRLGGAGEPCRTRRGQSTRSSPQKNSATVPGPVWLPMVVPMVLISTLPFSLGNFASTMAATAWASSRQADWEI